MNLKNCNKNKWIITLFLIAGNFSFIKADEGMWLLPMLKQQNAAQLKQAGLMLPPDSLYNPDGVSLKDAVIIFGNGCTGEVISSEGLVLTNHHCGYGAIQQHSTVEHNYLEDGFWAMTRAQELPTPGLKVEFIDQIEDVTDFVLEALAQDTSKSDLDYLSPRYLSNLLKKKYPESDTEKGIKREIKPFYGGNKYYLFTNKIYTDIRMVGAPPSSIGKFGADTDNWMWPRHTGDFSLFRIYADKDGNPAAYSKDNVPLHPKKWFEISMQGYKENDYAMIMGFPGSTNRFYTSAEVQSRHDVSNKALIEVREVRQKVLLDEMLKDPKVQIQYAGKYAGSSNYYKNSIGMNTAIDKLKIIPRKKEEENQFRSWALANGKIEYVNALDSINSLVERSNAARYQLTYLREVMRAIESLQSPTISKDFKKALQTKDKELLKKEISSLRASFDHFEDKDYNAQVDRKVAKAVLTKYHQDFESADLPDIFKIIEKKYKNNIDKFVTDCYEKSIYSDSIHFEQFLNKPSLKKIDQDRMLQMTKSFANKSFALQKQLADYNKSLAKARTTYIAGLMEKSSDKPLYPDANFTIRMTYGSIRSYMPKDGVHFCYQTSLNGVMEKEDSTNWEFVVPAHLKELWNKKDFGPYGLANGTMPVNFLSTNDITGGNSGSPVINAQGQLIGCAFDGNWEAMSGDIVFEPALQRTINVDIRYILFIIDKYAGASHLIKEMTLRP